MYYILLENTIYCQARSLGQGYPESCTSGFLYGIRHVFIVIQWTMSHSSLNHNENMPYPVWKCLPYVSAQALYYFLVYPRFSCKKKCLYINHTWYFFSSQGFTLDFHFSSNDFFTNSVLTKNYEMRSEPDEADPFSFEGPEIIKSEG